MANNFHDINGLLLVGLDVHIGVHIFPPIPMPFLKLNLLHPFTLGDKAKPTVLMNGVPAVAHYHTSKYLWPHIGVIPDPLDVLTPLQIARGKQRCIMPRTRVLIEDEVAACCMIGGPWSVNSDCWTATMLPSSLILDPGTVVTNPGKWDYLLAFVAIALDGTPLGTLGEGLFDIFDWFESNAAEVDCDNRPQLQDNRMPPWLSEDDVHQNIDDALAMRSRPLAERLTWFWAKVQTGGDWDYKKYSGDYEPFGNAHFGIVGRAAGIPEWMLLRGAGAFQLIGDGQSGHGTGKPWDLSDSDYGDNPEDQVKIKEGFDYYYHYMNCP